MRLGIHHSFIRYYIMAFDTIIGITFKGNKRYSLIQNAVVVSVLG